MTRATNHLWPSSLRPGSRKSRSVRRLAAALALATLSQPASADPFLFEPEAAILELVTPDPVEQAKLLRIDGLEFDSFGNLFGALEISGAQGGVVYIDKHSGVVSVLVTGIVRADQIAIDPSGDLWVTSEIPTASTTDRVFQVIPTYDANDLPIAASGSPLVTSLPIDIPEGLVVLGVAGPYGNAGDLLVCEDKSAGQVFRVEPLTGTTTVLATGLGRPEGMAIGDFGGALSESLYAAETSPNLVVSISPAGVVSTFGDPTAVSLLNPDNVEFGPDGMLYVTEDRNAPNSRVVRVASDGTHEAFAGGFDEAQGMVFDAASGDLYVAEQALSRIWRVRFEPPPAATSAFPGFCGYAESTSCGDSPDASCEFTIPGGGPAGGVRVRRCVAAPNACATLNAEIWVDGVHVANTGGLLGDGCSVGVDVSAAVGGAGSFSVELRNPVCLSGCCCGGTPGTIAPNWLGEIHASDGVFPAECDDGLDNDGDGLVDHVGGDPGCSHPEDEGELAAHLPCDNGLDDDLDGDTDLVDSACLAGTDGSEVDGPGFLTTCEDGLDNDSDGLTDLADPGCDDVFDLSETASAPGCDDFADDDGDGLVDLVDPDCSDASDPSELFACTDGIDNDGDGLTDFPGDTGCSSASDGSEQDPSLPCDDGIDNDGDGFSDFDALGVSGDPACEDGLDVREDTHCQDGINNDLDALIDFDGGQSIHGACANGTCPPGVSDLGMDGVADPDPQCVGRPWFPREGSLSGGGGCGVGPTLLIPIALLALRGGRAPRRRRRRAH